MLFSAQWCQCLQVHLKTSLPLRNCFKMSQSRRQADTSSIVTKNRTIAKDLSIVKKQPLKVMYPEAKDGHSFVPLRFAGTTIQ